MSSGMPVFSTNQAPAGVKPVPRGCMKSNQGLSITLIVAIPIVRWTSLAGPMSEPTLDSIAALSRLYANLLMVESRLLERLLSLRAQLPADDPLHGSLQDAIHSLQ